MPLGIDFSAIKVEDLDFISQKGKKYTLHDDVPFDVLLQNAQLRNQLGHLQELAESDITAEEAQALIDEWQENAMSIALSIFRNTATYAHITAEELRADFDVLRLVAIIDFFSTRLGEKSAALRAATATDQAPSTMNRTARRSQKAQERR